MTVRAGTAIRALALAVAVALLPGCAWVRTWQGGPATASPAASATAAMRAPAAALPTDPDLAAGLRALERDDVDAAIAAWRRYAERDAAAAPQAARVRGFLTLLERESARRFARRAAAGERASGFAPTDRHHVAVFPFASGGPNAARDPFNRAVLAMVSADLAQVPSLTVLERERVEALLHELSLAASGLVDPATLARPARLLGAGRVVAGSVYNEPGPAGPGSGRYRLATAVSDVGAGRVIGAQEAEGRQVDFQRLEKEIVRGILESMGITEFPPAVAKVHTTSWTAYARFAAGLTALAESRFDAAREAFRGALVADPAFDLAKEALDATPEKDASIAEMREALAGAR